jgi:large subunit ribosomal protein L17
MRHRRAQRKLGRTRSHREALLRNQATSLLLYERVVTTEAKAKELRRLADRLITLAKRGDLHARRQAAAVLEDPRVVQKLFAQLGGRYPDRAGGYTRITKLDPRAGDGAPRAAIELVGAEGPGALDARRGRKGRARKRGRAGAAAARPPSAGAAATA